MKKIFHIAIEGSIGVGKTSLAKLLAGKFDALLVLENFDDNPFLEDFYKDRKRFALHTQLYFLIKRYYQQRDLSQQDLFHQLIISDYIFAKNHIFASLNLEDNEFLLYQQIAKFVEKEIPRPDLVIYLQAETERLMLNIRNRDRRIEKLISVEYMKELNETYAQFFSQYQQTPLLIINVNDIDFIHNNKDFNDLVDYIMNRKHKGINFYNPGG